VNGDFYDIYDFYDFKGIPLRPENIRSFTAGHLGRVENEPIRFHVAGIIPARIDDGIA